MRTSLALLLLSLTLTACGYKGPLYLPKNGQPAPQHGGSETAKQAQPEAEASTPASTKP